MTDDSFDASAVAGDQEFLHRLPGSVRDDLYRNLVEEMPGVLYLDEATDDARTLYISPQVKNLLGYEPVELLDSVESWLDKAVHPDDRAFVAAAVVRNTAGSHERLEYRCLTKAGDVVWIYDDSAPIYDDDGTIVAIRGFLFDVSDRKRAEAELRAAETSYRELVEDIPGIVYVDAADETGSTIYMSPKVEKILGYKPEEWESSPDFFIDHVLHPDDRERLLDEIARNNAGIRNVSEYRCIAADGRVVWIYDESTPQLDENGEVVATRGFMLDITARKDAEAELALREEQLRRAQRMESIGRLAGGIAHDFNNLLTVIHGHLQLLLESPGLSPATADQLTEVETAASRAAELTRQLLAFSRQQVLQPTSLALDETVAALESMLRRLLPADVELVVQPTPTSPVVADRGQIDQVVTNLVLNARDAMPDGGRLVVEVGDRSVAEHESERVPAGDYVELRVRDTGHGMEPETLERMFEPFFTTKEPGRGTGLGLSTVEGIVAQSGGYLAADSVVGSGTTIAVYLPIDRSAPERERPLPPARPVGGSERLLVVEDDDSVRRLVGRILADLGYEVLEAVDPEHALRVVEAERELDLVVTDLVMPGATGRELAEMLAERRPELAVLFMSGYTDDEVMRRGLLPGTSAFIQKPFRIEELAALVREVLDARGSSSLRPLEPH